MSGTCKRSADVRNHGYCIAVLLGVPQRQVGSAKLRSLPSTTQTRLSLGRDEMAVSGLASPATRRGSGTAELGPASP